MSKLEIQQKKIWKNLKKCPSFERCSQNLCPLDLELHLRSGGERDKCRWMREPQTKKIKDKVFVSGGRMMPNAVLNFVPQRNLKWLNASSQKRWQKLKSNRKENSITPKR